MKSVLLGLAGLLLVSMAHAQESGPGVSVSRSVRQKINTKPIFEAVRTSAARNPNTPDVSIATTLNQLNAIQFVQSKAEFLPGAQPALEQLATFMRDKPTVEIELAGHTDNQGDFDQNVLLSRKRVDLVKAYLVQNGVAAKRITTRGYGPTRPIASNKTEATRQLNRRVEMLVLKQ
jgi:outer membrane protein OmpA-like peptidoglycan-associated protein